MQEFPTAAHYMYI